MSHPIIPSEQYTPGTAKAVRAKSRVPSVIYGHGQEIHNISIDKQEFRRAYRTAGKATLVEVEVSGKKIPSLVHVVDLHPISGDPVHVDFYAVNMKEEVHAVVPIRITGNSDAVKLLGGTLTTMINDVEIKCLPKHLIDSVDADISVINTFNDIVTVGDLNFPEGITVLTSEEIPVASVSAPRAAQEAEVEEEEEGTEEKDEEKAE